MITIDYTGRDRIQANRTVEPHQLVLKENNWYLRGYCRDKEDFRIFKLNRIDSIALHSETFEPREFKQELTDFKDWIDNRMIMVEILIDESYKERALDYIKESNMEPAKDGKILVHMPFVESELGYDFLLGLGSKCECVSPIEIRDELIRKIDELRDIYR